LDDALRSTPTISNLLKKISANCHLVHQEKLSAFELAARNRRLCKLIETAIASPGRDISEAVAAYPNLILVQRLVDRVVVYMPSTGHLRSVPLADKQPSKISMSFRKSRCEFVNRSDFFSTIR
jgi:hypothetical protein